MLKISYSKFHFWVGLTLKKLVLHGQCSVKLVLHCTFVKYEFVKWGYKSDGWLKITNMRIDAAYRMRLFRRIICLVSLYYWNMVLNWMSLESVCTKAAIFKGYFLGITIAPWYSTEVQWKFPKRLEMVRSDYESSFKPLIGAFLAKVHSACNYSWQLWVLPDGQQYCKIASSISRWPPVLWDIHSHTGTDDSHTAKKKHLLKRLSSGVTWLV